MKKGELAWDQIGIWILALVLLIVLLFIIFGNKETLLNLVKELGIALRFGGRQ